MPRTFSPIEVFGWYGLVAVLGAYVATSFGMIEGDDIVFLLLNMTGGAGICLVSWRRRVYQPAVLNAIWFLVGVVALAGAFR